MLGRHKYFWSANEHFAQKKNAGEAAKLKDTVARLDKKFGLVKDSIRQEAGQVRTSLKNIRKSTGHSIEALPPTPFQMDFRRDFTSLTIDTDLHFSPRQSNGEFDDGVERFNDGFLSDRAKVSLSSNLEYEDDLSNNTQTVSNSAREFPPHKDLSANSRLSLASPKYQREIGRASANSPNFKLRFNETTSLPSIKPRGNLINAQQMHGTPIPKIISDEPDSSRQERTDPEHFVPSSQIKKESVRQSQALEIPEGECGHENDNCLVSEHTEHTETYSIRSDRIDLALSNSHSNNNPAVLVNGRSNKSKEGKRVPPNNKEKCSQLRNTRTRCRTCLERFRLNKEYERQIKLEQEAFGGEVNGAQSPNKIRGNDNKKSCFINNCDLDSLLAESEVLDFDDEVKVKDKGGKRCQNPIKGYSRTRLERLAEPRTGRRKKLLFSKHLIKKEVDSLTERHSQPQLTEREKERLRIVESKIRMFLAVTFASGDVTPSAMVHIPHRDDVMKVDISHL